MSEPAPPPRGTEDLPEPPELKASLRSPGSPDLEGVEARPGSQPLDASDDEFPRPGPRSGSVDSTGPSGSIFHRTVSLFRRFVHSFRPRDGERDPGAYTPSLDEDLALDLSQPLLLRAEEASQAGNGTLRLTVPGMLIHEGLLLIPPDAVGRESAGVFSRIVAYGSQQLRFTLASTIWELCRQLLGVWLDEGGCSCAPPSPRPAHTHTHTPYQPGLDLASYPSPPHASVFSSLFATPSHAFSPAQTLVQVCMRVCLVHRSPLLSPLLGPVLDTPTLLLPLADILLFTMLWFMGLSFPSAFPTRAVIESSLTMFFPFCADFRLTPTTKSRFTYAR